MNGVKHGLCSSLVITEDAELIEERVGDFFHALKPQNEFHSWLVDQIALYSLRLDRAGRMERRLRDRRVLQAELAWDDELRLYVENLGAKIGIRPAEILEELRQTPVGCDWLISRWSMLAHAADIHPKNEWTVQQTAIAFNLMGTPVDFREGQQPGTWLDEEGSVDEQTSGRAAFARLEIARLQERREHVSHLHEVDRCLTRDDLFDESNKPLKNVRRHEATLFKRFNWFIAQLRYVSPFFKPDCNLRHYHHGTERAIEVLDPPPAPASEKPVKPKPKWMIPPNPPFDLEPSEIPKDGSKPDLLNILMTRQEKRIKKADARREAKRAKAQKLRE